MPKKPPYNGDPNATLTMCYRKRRRHLPIDFVYYEVPAMTPELDKNGDVISQEALTKAGLDKPIIFVRCRHCKEDPMKPSELEAVAA